MAALDYINQKILTGYLVVLILSVLIYFKNVSNIAGVQLYLLKLP